MCSLWLCRLPKPQVAAPQIGKDREVFVSHPVILNSKDDSLNRRVTMGAVLGLLNIYCTHWKDGKPLPNGLVEDNLFGASKEKLDPFNNSNGRYTNQFFEMILENHMIPYSYTDSYLQPFIYFLETCLSSKSKPRLNTSLSKIITPEICRAINKRGLLILYDSEGCNSHSSIMFNELRSLTIKLDKVICISASRQKDHRLCSYFISHLGEELYNSFIRNKSKTIKALKTVKQSVPNKPFICLTGRGDTAHKAFLVKKLYRDNLIKDCHFSLTLLYRQAYKKIIPPELVAKIPIYAEDAVPDKNIVYDLTWAQYAHLHLAAQSFINIVPTSTWRQEKQQSPEGRLPNDFYISVVAKRPFIIVSNFPNYLDTIKDLGYKTFDGILDESYDKEPDLLKRIDLVVEQMKDLKEQDLQGILSKCNDIFTHNLRHFMNNRTSQTFVNHLNSLSV